MKALMFTAGLGTRLRPLTEKTAKPTLPILNIPMLCYPLFALEQMGVNEITFNLHYLPETVREAVDKLKLVHKVNFSNELDLILESAGGMKAAEKYLSDDKPFITINGDAVFLIDETKNDLNILIHHGGNHFNEVTN